MKVNTAEAAPSRFDLQEECAAAAARVYRRKREALSAAGWSAIGYTSAYNRATGQCFAEVSALTDHGKDSTVALVEAPQGLVYGSRIVTPPFVFCEMTLNGKATKCASEEQFYSAVARYMGVPVALLSLPSKAGANP